MLQLNFHQNPQISGDHINQSRADRCGEGRDVGVRHLRFGMAEFRGPWRCSKISKNISLKQTETPSEYRPFDPTINL